MGKLSDRLKEEFPKDENLQSTVVKGLTEFLCEDPNNKDVERVVMKMLTDREPEQ